MSHSVLVVEDDTSTREYFAEALRGDGGSYDVATAASLAEGIAALHRDPPDVILVDLGLPDGSGLDLIRSARRLSSDILALVITVFGDETSVIGALEAGAQGYLLKSEAPADLRESVRQVLSGGAPISPGIASHLLRRFQPGDEAEGEEGEERADGEEGHEGEQGRERAEEQSSAHGEAEKRPRLTRRERQVLGLMVQGLPYQEAAESLGLTRNTVVGHVKKIYRKLEVSSRGEAVFEALSQGIVKLDRKS